MEGSCHTIMAKDPTIKSTCYNYGLQLRLAIHIFKVHMA